MFARCGGFGDAATAARPVRGERIAALLAQGRFAPLRLVAQVALLAALGAGVLDRLGPAPSPTGRRRYPGSWRRSRG